MDFPQTLTKKAIAKYRALHRAGKLSRGSDCGITLAYALWLANGRQGMLSACMELDGRTRDKRIKARFIQMVYQDPSGVTWDYHGRNAASRCEKAVRIRKGSKGLLRGERRPAGQVSLPFEATIPSTQNVLWQEIHPANLQWFAAQWGQDGIRTGDAMRMMEIVMRFEGAAVQPTNPRQMGLVYPDEGQPEPDLAPLNCGRYAQLTRPTRRAKTAPSDCSGI